MRVLHGVLAMTLVVLGSCARKPEAARVPAPDSAGTMGGMAMSRQGLDMIPIMRAHLDSLAAVSPLQMAAMMNAHQDLAARMMDAMGADMRGMHMKPDSAWAALSDSLRQDLAELPGRAGGALGALMQGHIGRMRRMMTMHEGMMRM